MAAKITRFSEHTFKFHSSSSGLRTTFCYTFKCKGVLCSLVYPGHNISSSQTFKHESGYETSNYACLFLKCPHSQLSGLAGKLSAAHSKLSAALWEVRCIVLCNQAITIHQSCSKVVHCTCISSIKIKSRRRKKKALKRHHSTDAHIYCCYYSTNSLVHTCEILLLHKARALAQYLWDSVPPLPKPFGPNKAL